MRSPAGARSRPLDGAGEGSHVDVWHPDWYRALRLSERKALLDAAPDAILAPHDLADEIVEEWASRDAFRDRADFHDRLATEGLTEESLRVLVGQPPEVWRDLHATPPRWLVSLAEAFSPACIEAAACLRLPETADERGQLVALALPLVARGRERLSRRIEAVRGRAAASGLDLGEVEGILLRDVVSQALSCSQRTLALEVNVFRLEGRLAGGGPRERFEDFVRQLADPSVAVAVLQEYSLLARTLVGVVDDWVEVSVELVERLVDDWPRLVSTFGLEGSPLRLQEVRGGAGDRHRGGRSVNILGFSSGEKLVYKPRSMAADRHFQAAVAWVDRRLGGIDLEPATVLDRGEYGWMEFLRHQEVASLEAVGRFYERLGAYLALLHVLHATDMHSENIIAAGEHPHIVDVEALLHPTVDRRGGAGAPDPSAKSFHRSVCRVGILPRRIWMAEDGAEGVDLSGVGGEAGQESPDRLPVMVDLGTDRMRVQRQRLSLGDTRNRPRLAGDGEGFAPASYADEVVAGFQAAYEALAVDKAELLADDGPLEAFRHDDLRQIVRPTRTYSLRLLEGTHPDYQRDMLDLEQFLDGLWLGRHLDDRMADVFTAEREDLLAGDVPFFSITAGSADLRHDSGRMVPGYAEQPGLEVARAKASELGAADLERQVWMIRASYTALTMGEDAEGWPTSPHGPAADEASADDLVSAARAVGDRVCRLAVSGDGLVSWLGLELVAEKVWSLQPASRELFHGRPGIALFLARLADVTGEERYADVARGAVAGLLRDWERSWELLEERNRPWKMSSSGAFGQIAGSLYALSHLGNLWDDARVAEAAERLAGLLPAAVEGDTAYDVIDGSAGCAAVLRSLVATSSAAPYEGLLAACGDRLVEAAQPAAVGMGWPSTDSDVPLTGFSHGAGGIAWALVELAALSRSQNPDGCDGRADRYERVAREALAYERSVYDPEHRNWPDLRWFRHDAPSAPTRFMCAWCHGAPGVGLSRALIARRWSAAGVEAELEAAVETTLRDGMRQNHSLCHGTLGNLELPLTAATDHGDEVLRRQVYRHAGGVLTGIAEHGWLTGVPGGVETPGLMAGLAGIGYGLLRLAAPERVPSVLALDPPLPLAP